MVSAPMVSGRPADDPCPGELYFLYFLAGPNLRPALHPVLVGARVARFEQIPQIPSTTRNTRQIHWVWHEGMGDLKARWDSESNGEEIRTWALWCIAKIRACPSQCRCPKNEFFVSECTPHAPRWPSPRASAVRKVPESGRRSNRRG